MRRRAFKAASKENKPLFGEDGKVRGMLEKYDDEEEEGGMTIDDQGAIEEATRKRQEDIRARLRAGILGMSTIAARLCCLFMNSLLMFPPYSLK